MFTHVLPGLRGYPETTTAREWLRALLRWVRQGLCGLRGHDALLRRERNRLFLECVDCGHRTPGWQLDGRVRLRETTRIVRTFPRQRVGVFADRRGNSGNNGPAGWHAVGADKHVAAS